MMTEKRKAYSIVQLVIIVIFLGILLVIAIPRLSRSATAAKANTCSTNVDVINTQIELYKTKTGSYLSALTDVTADPNYFRDGPPGCPFGTPYTMGANYRVSKHSH